LTFNLTGLCAEFFRAFFNFRKKFFSNPPPPSPTFLRKIVARNKKLLQGIIGFGRAILADTPELKGLVSPLHLTLLLTNRPKLFTMHQLPKIASSDHFTILAKPMGPNENNIESRSCIRKTLAMLKGIIRLVIFDSVCDKV
jgi:hypothetical protein